MKKKKSLKKHRPVKISTIKFLAPEFMYFRKGILWYLIIGVIFVATLALAVWQRNWFLTAIVVLSAVVFFQYAPKRPRSLKCRLGLKKIEINGKIFPISNFKSFYLIPDRPNSHLHLEKLRWFSGSLWLNIKNKDAKRIYRQISQILPESSPKINFLTIINRWIKF
ncbi:MAG TPA: hypothetical protein VJJ80_02250 [Patescibacteria group bacterium]|nr:hypothetical protein [Patescibacteria group bacterium]